MGRYTWIEFAPGKCRQREWGAVGLEQSVKGDGELVQRFSFASSQPFDVWKEAALSIVEPDRIEKVSHSRYAIWLEPDEMEAVNKLVLRRGRA